MPIRSRALTFDDRTGDQPRVVDTLVAEPGPGQIRVRMTAAAVLLPPEVPAHVAALIGCSVTTGYGAVHHTVPVRGGDTIVVTGCGGVGQAIIASAADAGAGPIIAVDRSPSRLAAARELGATHTVLADGTEVEQSLTICPDGVDYAFDAIGIPAVAARTPRYLRAGGTAVLVGMPAVAATAPIDTWDVVTRGLTVLGCNYGSAVPARDFPLIARAYLDGRLPLDRLVGDSVGLDGAAAAISALSTAEGGRTMVLFP